MMWLSAGLFGAYILAFYGGAVADGELQRWNGVLPGLYAPGSPRANLGMAAHLIAGGGLLLLGPVQFVDAIRARWPVAHRLVGRLFTLASLTAAAGGLAFILIRGTVGGRVMDLGFGLYGALMVLAAVETARHARARRVALHRRWALRLFALVIGSWLYRVEYGFWWIFTGGLGSHNFRGLFDQVMAFAFYAPNLLVAEAWIRGAWARERGAVATALAIAVCVIASLLLLVGTYFFVTEFWGPAIVARLWGPLEPRG